MAAGTLAMVACLGEAVSAFFLDLAGDFLEIFSAKSKGLGEGGEEERRGEGKKHKSRGNKERSSTCA